MQDIVNGGMYSINFQGSQRYEFKGIHPAIVIRTLREKELYFCVPLTTYTKDRWLNIKEKRFGYRIISTNSIARIDKLQIVEADRINNRWIDSETNNICMIRYDELESLNKKLNEYLDLSSSKALKEYNKYLSQYAYIEKEIVHAYKGQDSIFNIEKRNNVIELSVTKTALNNLSTRDLINILKTNIEDVFTIKIDTNVINIIIGSNLK